MRRVTDEQLGKRVLRKLRTIPIDSIASEIRASESERDGLWCLVAGVVSWVRVDGKGTTVEWCDDLIYAQYARWLKVHPERVHDSQESAVSFVRAHLVGGSTPQ
jgi:hypothetical protein